MATRRSSQLTIGFSPVWKRQAAWDVPVPGIELTRAFPATSRNYLDLDETTEDIMDCTGEDFLFELLTAWFARLNIDMDFDPDVFAGLAAGAFGVAGAPTVGSDAIQNEAMTAGGGTRTLAFQVGANSQTTPSLAWNAPAHVIQKALTDLSNVGVGAGAADEVQTETVTASGGDRTLEFMGHVTAPLAYNANAGTIQAALEALPNVAPGDITVAGAGPYTYTFAGAYAKTDVPLIVVGTGGLTGGTSSIVETTAGQADSISVTNPTASLEVQQEVMTASSGTRTLTFAGQTTAPINYDATASQIQTALETLSNVAPGDIIVTEPVAGTYRYTFDGAYRYANVGAIVSDGTLLVGGTSTMSPVQAGSIGVFIYTFAGDLGSQQVNLIVPNTFNLTGGTSVFTMASAGEGYEHLITRLAGYTLPLFTFYIGFRGSDKQPVIFKNVVVNSIRVRSASRERVTASVELIGSAEFINAVGYTMPPCMDIIPLRFGDCKMSINDVDYIANNLGREFEWSYSNDVVPRFDGAGINSTRHERADSRPTNYNMFVLGEPGDPLDIMAKLRQSFNTFLQLGPDGRNVKVIAPQCFIKLAPTPVRFGGDPAESELALVGRPRKVSGDASTPINIEAQISTSVALLGT